LNQHILVIDEQHSVCVSRSSDAFVFANSRQLELLPANATASVVEEVTWGISDLTPFDLASSDRTVIGE
jgi:hypothetical protein